MSQIMKSIIIEQLKLEIASVNVGKSVRITPTHHLIKTKTEMVSCSKHKKRVK